MKRRLIAWLAGAAVGALPSVAGAMAVSFVLSPLPVSVPAAGSAIDHGNGYISLYAHQVTRSTYVAVGQAVRAGDRIGSVGSTGASTGNHLHLGLFLNGNMTDPLAWLASHGVHLE